MERPVTVARGCFVPAVRKDAAVFTAISRLLHGEPLCRSALAGNRGKPRLPWPTVTVVSIGNIEFPVIVIVVGKLHCCRPGGRLSHRNDMATIDMSVASFVLDVAIHCVALCHGLVGQQHKSRCDKQHGHGASALSALQANMKQTANKEEHRLRKSTHLRFANETSLCATITCSEGVIRNTWHDRSEPRSAKCMGLHKQA